MTSSDTDLPPYAPNRILEADFSERVRLVCRSWAAQITPNSRVVMALYWAKYILLFAGGWAFWVSFSKDYPGFSHPGDWAFRPYAFQKAVLWCLAYESLGFGCSSGPMNARFNPPLGGFLYWFRTGTTKLALVKGLPLFGGTTRTWFDVALYAALQISLFYALMAPELTPGILLVPMILIPLNGIADKTLFLAARSEHYWVALICLTVAFGTGPATEDLLWVSACKVIWCFIWFWAATSKVNHFFPSVIMVMMNNAPFFPTWLKKSLMADYPDDLRPSKLAAWMSHFGAATEFMIPIILLSSDNALVTVGALLLMTSFHGYIGINNPSGMPIEWNVMMIFGGWFLFGAHPEIAVTAIGAMPFLTAFLLFTLFVIPAYGNFVPKHVSFLLAMRYYAGNWAYNVWLFKKPSGDDPGAADKLHKLKCMSGSVREQLAEMIPDEQTLDLAMAMMVSARFLHTQGKPLLEALPLAVDNIEDYEWWEGEVLAGQTLGWNFGDGHLCNENLLDVLQEQCGWEEGDVRVVMVESQPLFSRKMAWRIVDAATGVIEKGVTDVTSLLHTQPQPEGEHAEALRLGRSRLLAQRASQPQTEAVGG
jgi:hypothetical protein